MLAAAAHFKKRMMMRGCSFNARSRTSTYMHGFLAFVMAGESRVRRHLLARQLAKHSSIQRCHIASLAFRNWNIHVCNERARIHADDHESVLQDEEKHSDFLRGKIQEAEQTKKMKSQLAHVVQSLEILEASYSALHVYLKQTKQRRYTLASRLAQFHSFQRLKKMFQRQRNIIFARKLLHDRLAVIAMQIRMQNMFRAFRTWCELLRDIRKQDHLQHSTAFVSKTLNVSELNSAFERLCGAVAHLKTHRYLAERAAASMRKRALRFLLIRWTCNAIRSQTSGACDKLVELQAAHKDCLLGSERYRVKQLISSLHTLGSQWLLLNDCQNEKLTSSRSISFALRVSSLMRKSILRHWFTLFIVGVHGKRQSLLGLLQSIRDASQHKNNSGLASMNGVDMQHDVDYPRAEEYIETSRQDFEAQSSQEYSPDAKLREQRILAILLAATLRKQNSVDDIRARPVEDIRARASSARGPTRREEEWRDVPEWRDVSELQEPSVERGRFTSMSPVGSVPSSFDSRHPVRTLSQTPPPMLGGYGRELRTTDLSRSPGTAMSGDMTLPQQHGNNTATATPLFSRMDALGLHISEADKAEISANINSALHRVNALYHDLHPPQQRSRGSGDLSYLQR